MSNYTGTTMTNALKLLFNATGWANIADNTATSPATNIYVSLHNADPGAGGSQNTSETAYTNYARVAVARTSGGFTIAGSSPTVNVSNAVAVNFAQCGASGDTISYFGLGLSSSGAGTLLLSGPVGVVTSGPFGFTCTSASPGSMTVPGSAFSVNDRVAVFADAADTLPTGFTEGTTYYVGTASGITISLSTTASNANPVNTSSVGSGYVIKASTPLAVSNGVTPSFAIGALVAYLS